MYNQKKYKYINIYIPIHGSIIAKIEKLEEKFEKLGFECCVGRVVNMRIILVKFSRVKIVWSIMKILL